MHDCPRDVGVAGLFTAAGFIGGTVAAGGHRFADRHKRCGDIGMASVIFQAAGADGVFCFKYQCSFHLGAVTDLTRRRKELLNKLEYALPDASRIDADVLNGIAVSRADCRPVTAEP